MAARLFSMRMKTGTEAWYMEIVMAGTPQESAENSGQSSQKPQSSTKEHEYPPRKQTLDVIISFALMV
jgi:hypothetical protein